jgi:glucose-6-phosphate 1-dehydrogenase
LLVLRFANSIFEPLWNRNYIDHVQITVAEKGTIGERGDYYDSAGVLRDMFQNHLLQLLMVTAMEAPVAFEADAVRDEKVKVLRAIRPMNECDVLASTVRGQYAGYTEEAGVPRDSQTATFAAVRLRVNSWRWQGVPFYLRSGKGMSCRTTQIMIQFRRPPFMMFDPDGARDHDANRLLIQIQPAEGIQLHFLAKVPDQRMQLAATELDFRFRQEFGSDLPDAYQPLLVDALNGDASNFARADEVECSWAIIDPIQHAWDSGQGPPIGRYELGEWGPAASNDWIEAQGRQWFDTCPVIHEPAEQ